MAKKFLTQENIWLDKHKYDDAERVFYENKAKRAKDIQTPLAAEVGRAREWLTNIKNCIEEPTPAQVEQLDIDSLQLLSAQVVKIAEVFAAFEKKFDDLLQRVQTLESRTASSGTAATKLNTIQTKMDYICISSDEEDAPQSNKIVEERLKAYHAKKSKKPALIAKSNIILDVKPWGNETDMKQMEQVVREIKTAGLVWGASKLVPLAYGIYKLQISCVVEDELVSVDWLQEQIEAHEDFVQSVDIAAFNKV